MVNLGLELCIVCTPGTKRIVCVCVCECASARVVVCCSSKQSAIMVAVAGSLAGFA